MPRTGGNVLEVVPRVFRYCAYLEQQVGAAFGTVGLNRAEADLLAALLRSPKPLVPPSRLASALICSTGTMTNRLDRLERAGLVRRHDDPDDRRGVLIELTEKGRKTSVAAATARDRIGEVLVPGLTLVERKQMVRLLRKVLIAVEGLAQSPAPERSGRRRAITGTRVRRPKVTS
jgi:DNA-binding MarR family transcriptional regulator